MFINIPSEILVIITDLFIYIMYLFMHVKSVAYKIDKT